MQKYATNNNRELDNSSLVSVIVPIYNVATFIEKCVKSIMDQDYRNIEILLIDDGSPDESGQIIDRLATIDPRIQVVHKENAGVSSARNLGLEMAKGEYIAFIDGDDYIARDYISYLVNLAGIHNCDIAISANHFTSFNKQQISEDNIRKETAEYVIEHIYLMKLNEAVWNKLYRTQFIKENQLSFDSKIWYGEGMLFNMKCLQHTDYVAIGEKKIYHQVSNPNSAMRKFNLESNYCGIRSLELQKMYWKKRNKGIEDAWTYHYRCFSRSILNGLVESDLVKEYKDEYKKCIRNLRRNIMVPLKVNIPLKQKAYYIIAMFFPVLLAKRAKWKKQREFERLKNSTDFC